MRKDSRFGNRITLVLLGLLSLAGLVCWWWSPKSQPLSINEEAYVGFYRGLGLVPGSSVLGKQFFRVTVDDGEFGQWEVDYRRPGYNPYRGYYPSGALREEGECFVDVNEGTWNEPAPDSSDVRWGKYYRPDGTLGSEVVGGHGTQTLWNVDGSKRWELVLQNGQRVQHSIWYENGQLREIQNYREGTVDGEFTSYYPSGVVRIQGAYDRGERAGVWTRFDEDGEVVSIEDYAVSPPRNSTPSDQE